MAAKEKETIDSSRFVWGFVFLMISVLLVLSLVNYDWRDISTLKSPPNNPPSNLIGPVGAYASFMLFSLLGMSAYLMPGWCLLFGLLLIFDRREKIWPKFLWAIVLTFCISSLVELGSDKWEAVRQKLNLADAGGCLSRAVVGDFLVGLLSPVGAAILIWSVFVLSAVLLVGPRNMARFFVYIAMAVRAGWKKIHEYLEERQDRKRLIEREERLLEKRRNVLEKTIKKEAPVLSKLKAKQLPSESDGDSIAQPAEISARTKKESQEDEEESFARRLIKKAAKKSGQEKKSDPEKVPQPFSAPYTGSYQLPPLSILEVPKSGETTGIAADVHTTSRILEETLLEFGIEAKVTHVETGPVVTRYELLPAPGVRVERISGLSNNIALSLKASSVRIQAPIPGKGVVGIEVPNTVAAKVFLRDIMTGDVWKSGKACLPLALGKDVGGNDLVADLSTMPHILIAGATGAGKTVCMNSILTGLLMAKRPDELKLMLVDPKIVEFSVYNELPHLVVPVITNPKKVALGLRWAINEMERRYKLFAKVGVRNIESFNNREISTQTDLFGGSETTNPKDAVPEKVPYIVIVIDELADLMLTDQAEIENCIARLAQLSRAVGIHMILSTQRPSVNVITGTIKANFPSRIAFQVAQKVDSRTILDTVGAEKLLGRGDMLFLPPGASKLIRAQGAMTTDADVNAVVAFIKKQGEPQYEMEIQNQIEKSGSAPSLEDTEDDDVVNQAIEVIRETQRASTSSLQRRLRIGYTRAARIMDILEERGIVGPPRGSDPREILVDLDSPMEDNLPPEGDI